MAKRVRVVFNVAYLTLSHKAENALELCKPLLFVLLGLTERSWVVCVAIVLVQMLRDKVQVPLFESLTPLVYEFDLCRIGGF